MHEVKRRTRSEVLREILSIGPGTVSHIRFGVGMNYKQARRYVPFLVKEGYLEDRLTEGGKVVYHVTERGKRLLQLLNVLSELFDAPIKLDENERRFSGA